MQLAFHMCPVGTFCISAFFPHWPSYLFATNRTRLHPTTLPASAPYRDTELRQHISAPALFTSRASSAMEIPTLPKSYPAAARSTTSVLTWDLV